SPSHELNKHLLTAGLELLRPHRRRGMGRIILARSASFAEARGRTAIESWADEEDGKAFAAKIGAKIVQHRLENRLALDRVDWSMVDGWVAEGPRRNPATELRWFRNTVPEDIIDEYSRAFTEVFNQQPFGE